MTWFVKVNDSRKEDETGKIKTSNKENVGGGTGGGVGDREADGLMRQEEKYAGQEGERGRHKK